ncbi:hypothetical protein [Microbacterium capsulatum]|uniref:Uncharacterized protein n=1 Tax=Microbacterium capsulatum TaxID=3041921 RepID=A0ABU0XF75_9MICO|nr:hypothetical protein [Microbacterium sp. ASV81]MDQ4213766.1 hypothetical protein [Microbacterium sp. ASV81]
MGLIWGLLELLVKLMVLTSWFTVLLVVGLGWLLVALVQVCMRRRVSPFPRGFSRTTSQLVRWLL